MRVSVVGRCDCQRVVLVSFVGLLYAFQAQATLHCLACCIPPMLGVSAMFAAWFAGFTHKQGPPGCRCANYIS